MKKLASLPALLKRRRAWKRARKQVVFTNGCFDLLHPGHVRLLARARACGDVLIVGLNSDASVRRLKGRGRPIQDARARAEVLSALEAVDAVVVFGEPTPSRLLSRLRPEVLVKGADYREHEIAGRRYAGRVVRVRLAPGRSTTKLVERLRKRP